MIGCGLTRVTEEAANPNFRFEGSKRWCDYRPKQKKTREMLANFTTTLNQMVEKNLFSRISRCVVYCECDGMEAGYACERETVSEGERGARAHCAHRNGVNRIECVHLVSSHRTRALCVYVRTVRTPTGLMIGTQSRAVPSKWPF